MLNLVKMFAVIAAAIVMSLPVYADKVKVGFVYVGPTGDHGWTYRHDIGRKAVEAHFGDAVETTFQENVPKWSPKRTSKSFPKSVDPVEVSRTSF